MAVSLSDIDLVDPDRFVSGVPHEMYEVLRKEAPVYWHPRAEGPGFWALTKHDDVVAVSRNSESFSSERGTTLIEIPGGVATGILTSMDPPRHTGYRLLINKGFTPRMIGRLEAHIRNVADRILDQVAEVGECDFVTAISAELSLQVIAELIGIPLEDRQKIFHWSNAIGAMGVEDPEYAPSPEESQRAAAELYTYAGELAAERRRNPRDDIVTTLLNAEVGGEKLTETQFNQFFLLLAVAGNETTRNALSHGMLALSENPAEKAKLVANPALMPGAVEEILRWAPPVMWFRRTATRDTMVRGQAIRRGDWVMLFYVSANRDEEVFAEPHRFHVERDPNPHVTFGGGPHFCLGAELARLEIRVMFEELLRRLPDIDVAGPAVRLRSSFFNGIKHLPVAFTPTSGGTGR